MRRKEAPGAEIKMSEMFENKDNRTEVSQLGEFGLIQHITQWVKLNKPTSCKGIGDDAAIIDCEKDTVKVVSTDTMMEGVHFDLTYTPLKHLGYKAVIINLSDIYAMNAIPEQITVSIALSNRVSLEAVEELYSGIALACQEYNVDLIGGDTCSSVSGLVISITAIGVASKEKVSYREGAKETNLICVSGDLGAAYMGLKLLEREKLIYLENPNMQPDLQGKDYLLERQLKPDARKDIINWFHTNNIVPTSMIDISDGLSSELLHICKASACGCLIYEERIPVDHLTAEQALEFNMAPSTCALNGGEDYELLFTVPVQEHDRVSSNPDITIIGHITSAEEGKFLCDSENSLHELSAQGWNAFTS